MRNKKGFLPSILLEARYRDIESLGLDAGWKIDFRQLEPGPLEARLLMIGHSDISVLRVEFNRSFHQLGEPPGGYRTFGLPDTEAGELRWSGAVTPPGVLINFNYERMLDTANTGPFGGFVLMFRDALLSRACDSLGVAEPLLEEAGEHRFWFPEGGHVGRLRGLLRTLQTVAENEGNAGLQRWSKVFNEDLPGMLVRVMAAGSMGASNLAPKFRAAALDRALEVLSSYDRMPDTVQTLCDLAGASWSTLQRAFREEFGVGPKAYMKVRRLAAVQAELVRQGPGAVIRDVANRWGFWHMGSFAADYRKQFGELPSETLQRLERP